MEKSNDLISRQATIDAIRKIKAIKGTSDDKILLIDKAEAQTKLMMLPSAQPEHIRCKDCKNWQTEWTPIFSDFTPEDHFCSLVDLVTEDDFFCGYAERKDNG